MIIVSRAPFATATSAIRLKIHSGTPTPDAETTASRGPVEPLSSSAGSAIELARPTST